jgi:hypothetical protein
MAGEGGVLLASTDLIRPLSSDPQEVALGNEIGDEDTRMGIDSMQGLLGGICARGWGLEREDGVA